MYLPLKCSSTASVALEAPLKMVFSLGKNQSTVINLHLGNACSSQLSAISFQLLIFG
jgi:hypothetical protein